MVALPSTRNTRILIYHYQYRLNEKYKAFADLYKAVRDKEQRNYPADILRALPDLPKEHPHKSEWEARAVMQEVLHKYILLQRGANQSILDVGCGNGWFTRQLRNHTAGEIKGIDINHYDLDIAIEYMRDSYAISYEYGNLADQVEKNVFFDIITFGASIQYYPSLTETLNLAFSLLKTNGEILIVDSRLYRRREIPAAQERSRKYYEELGFPEMAKHYFHHSLHELKNFKYDIIYDPRAWYRWFDEKRTPLYLVRVYGKK
jgi:ubiquinone/menaquinone biosynthesis C-methylase UbiE